MATLTIIDPVGIGLDKVEQIVFGEELDLRVHHFETLDDAMLGERPNYVLMVEEEEGGSPAQQKRILDYREHDTPVVWLTFNSAAHPPDGIDESFSALDTLYPEKVKGWIKSKQDQKL